MKKMAMQRMMAGFRLNEGSYTYVGDIGENDHKRGSFPVAEPSYYWGEGILGHILHGVHVE